MPAGARVVADDPEPAVMLSLHLLREPVERRSLLGDPLLAGSEVLRMPAGSNPSFLSPERFSALLDLLSPHDLADSGWADPRVYPTQG